MNKKTPKQQGNEVAIVIEDLTPPDTESVNGGAGNLTKVGGGTVILSNANTYNN